MYPWVMRCQRIGQFTRHVYFRVHVQPLIDDLLEANRNSTADLSLSKTQQLCSENSRRGRLIFYLFNHHLKAFDSLDKASIDRNTEGYTDD